MWSSWMGTDKSVDPSLAVVTSSVVLACLGVKELGTVLHWTGTHTHTHTKPHTLLICEVGIVTLPWQPWARTFSVTDLIKMEF